MTKTASSLFNAVILIFGLAYSSSAIAYDTSAKHAFLIDFDTNQVLFEKNSDVLMPPASMSKIMTAYLAFEEIKSGRLKLEDKILISENAWRKRGSKMFVEVNDEVAVSDILRGIIVQSGNDAAIALAEHLQGSEAAFADKMTKKARDLGLKKAKFKNATGWPDEEHKITARELGLLAKLTIMNFPDLYSIYAEKSYTFNNIKQGNRNPLLYDGSGSDGLKTGHTKAAGYGLTASVSKAGRRLVMVLNGMKSSRERKREAKKLIEWGFREYENYKIFEKEETVTDIDVWLGKDSRVSAFIKDEIKLTVRRTDSEKVKTTLHYEEPIAAPIKQGQIVGILKIKVPNQTLREYPLFAKQSIEKLGVWGRIIAAVNYLVWGAGD
tara:strand:+ start:490 stop:1632 length:1143 start_codon:yes stop_codon:yes gene_type:complete